MFTGKQQALRVGLATAAMIGIAAVPTAVMASNNAGASHDADPLIAGQAAPRADHLTALATALGVTPDALKAAMTAARTSVGKPDAGTFKDKAARDAYEAKYVAALAANLKLDVAKVQAALDAQKPQPGQEGKHGPGQQGEHRGPGGPGGPLGTAYLDKVASAVGVTTDALKAAMTAARTSVGKPDPGTLKDEAGRQAFEQKVLAVVAANLNVDAAKLQAAMQAARPDPATVKTDMRAHLATKLAADVASGKITQAQADKILADFDAGKAKGPGGPEGHGGPRGKGAPGQQGQQGQPGGRGQGGGQQPGGGNRAPQQNAG